VAVPAARVHIGKASFGGYGIIYATATVVLNPTTREPQGGEALLYRQGSAPSNSRHGRIRGSSSWWAAGDSPYTYAPPVANLEKISHAVCRYVKSQLQAIPTGC
jgi:hypothetical protein